MDQLEIFGAKPVKKRIVRDRNRITGGGVTAGIDFALYLASVLVGEQTARTIQLSLEYNPDPPFTSGSPDRLRQIWCRQPDRVRHNVGNPSRSLSPGGGTVKGIK